MQEAHQHRGWLTVLAAVLLLVALGRAHADGSEAPPVEANPMDDPARALTPVQWRDSWGVGQLDAQAGQRALKMLLPYAELATLAYCDPMYGPKEKAVATEIEDATCRAFVQQRLGWKPTTRDSVPAVGQWTELKVYAHEAFGTRQLHGLRLATFMRHHGDAMPVELVFAFRGTDFRSFSDWHANLRWVLPGRDQYHVLSGSVGLIVDDARREAQARLRRPITRWHVVTTGHSLGGALAQLFAYKNDAVAAAVVFSPSPVTGFHSAVHDHEVNCNVPVWRVYERGEVLSYVRSMTRQFYRLSENIVELEFQLLGGNPIYNHSMPRFYETMLKRAGAPTLPLAAPAESEIQQTGLAQWRPDCTCSKDRRPQTFWDAGDGARIQPLCKALADSPPQDRPFVNMGFQPGRRAP